MIERKYARSILEDTLHITDQERLHNQPLNRTDKQQSRRLRVEVHVQLPLSLSFFDQALQSRPVSLDECLGYVFSRCFFSRLQLAKQEVRNSWMDGYKFSMSHKHGT